MRHLVSIDQFDPSKIDELFQKARRFEQAYSDDFLKVTHPHKTKLLTNLFYEPSTRTSSSFYAAMNKLGGGVIPINEVKFSSVVKGETLEDTIRTMGCYSDIIVLRHPEVGAARQAAEVSPVPIVNAGDGAGEHPTQSLLDLYTIMQHQAWGMLDFKVGFMGDLKNGRTVHSLSKLLSKYNVSQTFIAHNESQMPSEYLNQDSVVTDDMYEVIEELNVLYVTRPQGERQTKEIPFYGLTEPCLKLMKKDCMILHPLPRNEELPTFVDDDPRAWYFKQMKNGLWIRMAILSHLLDGGSF